MKPGDPIEPKPKKIPKPNTPPPHIEISELENLKLEKQKQPLMRHRWIKQKIALENAIEHGLPTPVESIEELPAKEILRNDLIFQHRLTSKWISKRHTEGLLKSLRVSGGKPFPPLTIFWDGAQWVLVDGHHRHEAYIAYQNEQQLPTMVVPISIFKGTLDEAIGEALKGNSRDKLLMTSLEKSEGAWRLTLGTSLSFNEISKSSTRSRSTATNMRRVMKVILQTHSMEELLQLSWVEAQLVLKGIKVKREFDEDRVTELAQRMANSLLEKFGTTLGRNPEVVFEALCIYDSTLLPALMDLYREPDDDEPEVYTGNLGGFAKDDSPF